MAEVLSYPRKSIRRNNIWKYIRNKGGYEVNIERFKSSRPIQPSCKLTVSKDEELLPCNFCFGIFKARIPADHTRNCFMKNQPSKSMERRGSYVKEARMMLSTRISDGHSDFVSRFILPSMRRDECHLIIRSDKLLMTFAAIELEKREPERYCDVSYSLRILAKLILSHREIHQNSDFNAKDIVLPKNYDNVKNVIKRMAGYKGPRDINNPHIIIRTGYAMKTLAIIVKLENLKIGGHDMIEKMRCFIELYESDYLILTNNSKSFYEKKKGNKPEELLLESDIKLLREFCVKETRQILSLDTLLTNDYVYLSKVTYARLLTFNARRGGEPGKLTLKDWRMVENDRWKKKEDIERLKDPVERKLVELLKLCYVEGKKKK